MYEFNSRQPIPQEWMATHFEAMQAMISRWTGKPLILLPEGQRDELQGRLHDAICDALARHLAVGIDTPIEKPLRDRGHAADTLLIAAQRVLREAGREVTPRILGEVVSQWDAAVMKEVTR